jgi:hypothetical protein
MLGASFSWLMCGKAPPETPAFQPYRGKPAVRNDREGRGNDGIIRSPGSRLDSTRLRDEAGQPPHLLGGFGDQEPIPSHRKLLWSKATVVSVAEKSKQDFGRCG